MHTKSTLLLAGWLVVLIVAPGLGADDPPPARPAADDWPWWRGPNRDDIMPPGPPPPLGWSPTQNVLWKSDLPGQGHATPCIWGSRIFISAAEGQSQLLLALDRATGKILWRTELNRGGLSRMHRENTHASATPACDGHFVFVNLVHHDAMHLAAVDFQGKLAWQTRLGPYTSMHGLGASPCLAGPYVYVACDSLKDSFICAVHRRTGQVAWSTPRESYRLGTYASCTFGRVAGREQLLIQGPFKIFSYDPADGKTLWTCDGPNESATSTLTMGTDRVYAAAGFPSRNLLCVRADGKGDVTGSHVVWAKERDMAYVPSLLLADGLLYQVEDTGRLTVFDAGDGSVLYQHRLPGEYRSSPVLAGGHVFVVNMKGLLTVFKAGRTFEQVAANSMDGGGFATPVILNGRMYLRTLKSLWCIQDRESRRPEGGRGKDQ